MGSKDTCCRTMTEACRSAGLSYETLKFYCRQGLVPKLNRDARSRRVFTEEDLLWLSRLKNLRACGFSLAEIRGYLLCGLEGEKGAKKRKAALERQKACIEEQMRKLRSCLDFIQEEGTRLEALPSAGLEPFKKE